MREGLIGAVFPPGVSTGGALPSSPPGISQPTSSRAACRPCFRYLILDRGYSYAAAGAPVPDSRPRLVDLQPLLGVYADRVQTSWLMWAGLLLAGGGLAVLGPRRELRGHGRRLPGGGIGVAAFHPEAVRFASYVSATRRGAEMSVFAVRRHIGFALGPIYDAGGPLARRVGHAVVGAVILAAGAAVLLNTRYLERSRPSRGDTGLPGRRPGTVAAVRARLGVGNSAVVVGFGLQYAVPLWVVAGSPRARRTGRGRRHHADRRSLRHHHRSRLADRYGFHPVVVWSLALGVPLAVALPFADTWTLFPLMAALGSSRGANFYPLIVIAQNALPGYLGFTAGVVLGLGIGIGAGVVALLGVLGDAAGMTAVIWAIAGFAALAYVLAAGLPPTAAARRRASRLLAWARDGAAPLISP